MKQLHVDRIDRRVGRLSTLLLAGSLSCCAAAYGQAKAVPDAQVESNVLKALAGAPELANQPIQTSTVYGVVTLSGSVDSEPQRTKAETLASRAAGVQKVIDELVLGSATASSAPAPGASSLSDATNPNLQSDGTMAPAAQAAQASQTSDAQAAAMAGPGDNTQDSAMQNMAPQNNAQQQQQPAGPPQYRQPYGRPYGPPPGYNQPGYNQQPYSRQQAYAPNGQPYQNQGQPYYGQQPGQLVTVQPGAMVRVQINHSLDSGRSQPGTTFDGIVLNDVIAGGAVAIPRGASVQGTIVTATKSGALTGRGELALQLTQVMLGGKVYPLVSDQWAHHGGDKTIETVNKTAIGGGIGALFGAAAGGGVGAAIGAGVGGALGLGSSAASGNGQVFIPAEGTLTFRIAQPVSVATVSQGEMERLAQGVRGVNGQPQLQRRYVPVYVNAAPGYYRPYPSPYGPYPY